MKLLFVVAALLAATSCAATICPEECHCQDYPSDLEDISASPSVLTSVSCQRATLNLPLTTNRLSISSSGEDLNIFFNALINVTQILPNFTDLSLTECSVKSIEEIPLNNLECLTTLELSHNSISSLPNIDTGPLSNLTKLKILDISCNNLREINGSPFSGLLSLEKLNLSTNKIHNISADGFDGLNKLMYLDLSTNDLSAIGVFSDLPDLQYLNLSNNRIESLEEECFSRLIRLQQLDVSRNQLTRVEAGALQALPSLARLTLAGNPHLGDLFVGTGRRLQAVDASRTGLAHVPSALTRSVRALRLAGNSIQTLQCGDLDSYPLLRLLDLSANGLKVVEDDSLGRLDMLSTLYLSENRLKRIPKSLPTCLKTLHLERNSIERVSIGDLTGLTQLEVLLLSDNDISEIEEGSFDDLTALVTLDLSGNPLSSLNVLAGPIGLQVLRLAGLPMAAPARDTAFPVHSPDKLVSLDLTASPGLARVLLADSAALAASRLLQELSLAEAGLVHIRSDMLHFLPQLRSLRLTGNRLDCSGLLWLARWMRLQNRIDDRAVLCAAPPDLAGSLLIDLQEGDLYETTIPSPTTQSQSRFNYDDHIMTTLTTIINISRPYSNNRTNASNTYPQKIFSIKHQDKYLYSSNMTRSNKSSIYSTIEKPIEYIRSAQINLSVHDPQNLYSKLQFGSYRNQSSGGGVINDVASATLIPPRVPEAQHNLFPIKFEVSSNKNISIVLNKTIDKMQTSNYTHNNRTELDPIQNNTRYNFSETMNKRRVVQQVNISTPSIPHMNSSNYVNVGGNDSSRSVQNLYNKFQQEGEESFFDNDTKVSNYSSVTEKFTTKEFEEVTESTSTTPENINFSESSISENKDISPEESTAEMSMYKDEYRPAQGGHPGTVLAIMLLTLIGLSLGIVIGALKWGRIRRRGIGHQQNIEVNQMPVVTDLW